jgi:hypothetical protein
VSIEKRKTQARNRREIDAEFVRQVRVQASNIRTHLWLTESVRSRASASSSRRGRVPECHRCPPDGAALGSVALRQRYQMPTPERNTGSVLAGRLVTLTQTAEVSLWRSG